MDAQHDALTLVGTEEDGAALEIARSEVSRLRAALAMIQNQAALLMGVADSRKQSTLASGFELLAGLAGDALEQ
jgi:predicted DNA-binding protein (UPF0251 family)